MKKIIPTIYKINLLNLPISFINLPTPINISYNSNYFRIISFYTLLSKYQYCIL
jgi:hypothetical protein